ncbi:MAG: PhnE/PtxC family ABC transporter permease [Xenococcaceae cyanobacterium]
MNLEPKPMNFTSNNGSQAISDSVIQMLAKEDKRVTNGKIFFLVAAIATLIFSYRQSELNFPLLLQRGGNMVEYVRSYFPPDFSYWKTYLDDTLITVSMGIWGTLLAAIAAIPLSILASENVPGVNFSLMTVDGS